jgi:serine/threonine protein phosphatase PrpC
LSSFGAHSAAGLHHENQDAWIAQGGSQESGILLAVCDGVSSTERGGYAAELLSENLERLYTGSAKVDLEELWSCILETDWELFGLGRGKAACTLSLVWLYGSEALILSVGDSPVLLCRDGLCSQLTESTRKGGLSGFVGMGRGLDERLVQSRLELHPGDVLILVTDGVSGSLSMSEFAACCEEKMKPQACAEKLVDLARHAGSDDDNTAIVLCFAP